MSKATYPIPSSLGAHLYSLDKQAMDARYGALRPVPVDPSWLTLPHVDIDSLLGGWIVNLSRHGALGAVQFPPAGGPPERLDMSFTSAASEGIVSRLGSLGFPAPEMDPTFVCGTSVRDWRLTGFLPGPGGLASLIYNVNVTGNDFHMRIHSTRPPEPRFSQRVQSYRRVFDWVGTMYFKDSAELEGLTGRLYSPGHWRMRTLI